MAASGPKGWLEWSTDYRNMLVHRGRRMQMTLLDRRGATLFAPDGSPVLLAREVLQLAQDPALSDVEALLSASVPVLTEDAGATLDGVMASTIMLAETISASLVEIWKRRRAAPSLLTQPTAQWAEGTSSVSRGFAGYKPDAVPFSVDTMVAEDTFIQRLKSAALDDRARKKWDTFD